MAGAFGQMETYYRPKTVFPALYFLAFAITLGQLFLEYMQGDYPAFAQSFVGDANKITVWIFSLFLVASLCIYMLAYYVRLELFEKKCLNCERGASKLTAVRILEYIIRFVIVLMITLKIVKFHAFSDLFLFLTITSFLFLVWHMMLRICFAANEPASVALLHMTVCIIALVGFSISTDPDRTIHLGTLTYTAIIVITIFLLQITATLVGNVAREAVLHTSHFLKDW